MYQGKVLRIISHYGEFDHIFPEMTGVSVVVLLLVQIIGSEDRRRTLTPLVLRERYSALNEPAKGIIKLLKLSLFFNLYQYFTYRINELSRCCQMLTC